MTTPLQDPRIVLAACEPGSANEQSFEDLYEHAPCGHLSTLADGTVIRVNQTFLNLTGYPRTHIVGLNFASLLTTASALFYETRCLPVLRLNGEVHEVALRIRCLDGASLSTVINSTMRVPHDGQPPLIQTAVFDSTQRRDYERDLLQARRAAELSEARAQVLHQAATTFGSSESEESLTSALAETARTAFDATSTSVRLLDDAGAHLVAGTHPVNGSEGIDATGPEAEALRSAGVVTIGNPEEAHRIFPAMVGPMVSARLEAMSVIAIPGESSPLGLLTCFFGRRRVFDDHVLELHADLARYAGQVLRRIRLQSELQHLATHDQLTGLANRALLSYRLRQVLSSAARNQRTMALLYLDLDGFKTINDRLGHAAGDSVLTQVSDRLRHVIRASDTIARLGGDEFVVVCEDTTAESAVLVAERIRDCIRHPLTGVPPEFALTASIGVALHHPNGDVPVTADVMLRQADAAMYASKNSGRDGNTVVEV